MERNRSKAPSAIYGPSRPKFFPLEKANAISECLENQFTQYDLCEENHEMEVEARVQALSEAVDNSPPPWKKLDIVTHRN